MHKCQTICFCFPYRGRVGGVPTLFSGVARQLALKGYSISIADYKDGTLRRLLRNEHEIRFYEYKDDYDLFIDDDFVVFQSLVPWSMYRGLIFSDSTRLFFWNCHPYNLVPQVPVLSERALPYYIFYKVLIKLVLYSYVARTKKFVQYMDEMHALVFMDGGNLRTTEYFLDLHVKEPVFLPIPVLLEKARSSVPISKNIENICWAGRAVKSKMVPLIDMLRGLSFLEGSNVYTVHIIGEGEFLDQFKRNTEGLLGIDIHYHGIKPYEDLMKFVRDEADFCAASGTLALNFSSMGVPTILLDVSTRTMSDRQFRFMHEVVDFSLGDTDFDIQRKVFESNLESQMLLLKSSYKVASEKSVKYVAERHNMQSICDSLIGNMQKSKFYSTLAMKEGFFSRPIIYSIFKLFKDKRK